MPGISESRSEILVAFFFSISSFVTMLILAGAFLISCSKPEAETTIVSNLRKESG